MKWQVHVGRRRLDVPTWLVHSQIKSYEDLVLWCKHHNVEAPPRGDTKGWWPKTARPTRAKSQDVPREPEPESVKKPKPQLKKPTRAKQEAPESPQEPTSGSLEEKDKK